MNRQDNHEPQTDTKQLLTTAHAVSQTFVSHTPNLNIVSICLRNPARLLAPITFSLKEEGSSTTLRQIDFSGGNVSEDDCTRLQFAPIEDSAGRTYRATLTSNSFANQRNPADSMYVEVASDNNYREGSAYIDGVPLGQDLHFKTFYRQSTRQVASESVSQFVHRLPLDPLFMVPYGLLLAVVLFKLLRK